MAGGAVWGWEWRRALMGFGRGDSHCSARVSHVAPRFAWCVSELRV